MGSRSPDLADAILEYGVDLSPAAERDAIVALAAFFFVVAGFLHFGSYVVGTTYVAMWRALGSKLPAISAMFVEFTQWIAFRHGWIVLWTGAVAAPLLIGRLRPRWPLESNGVYLLLILALALVVCMTIFLIVIAAPLLVIYAPVNTSGPK